MWLKSAPFWPSYPCYTPPTSLSLSLSPPILTPSLSSTLYPAKLFLAWEKKVFTLQPGPAGITLCSHWLNPLLPLHGLHIFPVLQDVKKGQIKKKKRKKESEKNKSLPLLLCVDFLWCCRVCMCVGTHTDDSCINRNTNSRTTNSSEACGLQTNFYTSHMRDSVPVVSGATRSSLWITGDCSYWM